MQNINTIINTLREAGVHVFLDEEKLKTKSLKGSLTPTLINLIKNNKERIVKKIKHDTISQRVPALERTAIKKITRVNHKAKTSYAQQRLWFIDKMDGGSAHYNMPYILDIKGDFAVNIAQTAFSQIIERHEPLRTAFVDSTDGPMQVIKQQFEFILAQTDLSELSIDAQIVAIDKAISQDAELSFNLSDELMLRVSYLKVNADEGVMLLNIHHIASDGWSIGLLVNEFTQLYQSILKNTPSLLPPLTIHYADYAHWQRQWLQGQVLESQLTYWDKQLADLPQVHSLPLDFERPVLQTFNGALYHFNVDGHTLNSIKTIVLDNQVTLFMLVHAAFSILLSRYSNSTDIVIGTPVANRLQKELEPLIGFFANTLVLRTDSSGNPSFTEFLSQVKSTNLAAHANQDVPFEHLVDRLNPVRSTSHNALFQILLMMDGDKMPPITIPNIEINKRDTDQVPIKFELTLNISEENNQLKCIFQYNTDLFKPKTIERLASSMQHLLMAIAANPQQSIAQLPLLSKQAINYQLSTLNNAQIDYSQDVCIHQLFEEQVKKTPDERAITFAKYSLSYAELNEQANQLAHYLIEQGVKPDRIVGLCINRSLEMIVGLLAILKAGGAYLPLDPVYPKARLEHMIADSDLSLLLTQGNLTVMTAGQGVQQLIVDDQQWIDTSSNYPSSNPIIEDLNSNHLAYVIYTSGSTGLPKGVLQKHGTIVNLVHAQASESGLNSSMKTLQFAPIGFDVSIQEIASCWFTASPLVLISKQAKDELNGLPQLLQNNGIERVFLPPAVLNWLAEDLINQGLVLPDLKEIIVAGEALVISQALKDYLLNKPDCTLWNHYGPTETHVATIAVVDVTKDHISVPIGSVLANLSIFILDSQQQVVPYGAVGELYIGGAGLARGYLNQAELTAECFITHPFSADDVLYRTGDLVRYLHDGDLAFMGRSDDQVKIRGFRIELGEIEQQLSTLADVQSSLVIIHETTDQQKQLVAYLTTKHSFATINQDDFIAQLRKDLHTSLPDYMLPSIFIILEQLPLTANGKIDRKALPEPDASLLVGEYIAPQGDTELKLAAIWSDLLKIPLTQISVDSHFFELGGHSLLSMQVIHRVFEATGVQLNPRELLLDTLEQIASIISEKSAPMAELTNEVSSLGIKQN
ncbi:MAG: amino acid adenylation domain-containing protein, partial [Alcanivoracaceae bacterium]|nr:amino acid adenylation domain-containing protein [Alcanivoracaceae bacterium]